MSCEHDWTFRFPDVGFEIRPTTIDLNLSRREYDFCRAKFFYTVGEEMKPHTSNGGKLDRITSVDVLYNGEPIKRLLFRPDWVTYNEERTEIEFHDFHKALADARVDIQRFEIQLKDIYKEVINQPGNDIIPTITDENFQLAENQVRTLFGGVPPGIVEEENIETDDTKRLIEGKYAINFDNISAEEAVARLNEKFGLHSWSNESGELIIGVPEENEVRHVAADGDSRVWKYKNPSISHGREPVKRVLVEGPWIDEPGIEGASDAFREVKSWFTEGRGSAEYRSYGIAERTDIDYGTVFTVKAHEAKRDALPEVAILALREKMKSQNAGTVEIDTELSGTEVSDPVDMKPGDSIQLVPDDEPFDNVTATTGNLQDSPDVEDYCGTLVHNETYLISDVQHRVTDSGRWRAFADVAIYPDVPIESGLAYFDPTDREWLDDSKIASDGDLKGGFFEED